MTAAPPKRWSESSLLDALEASFEEREFAFMRQVSNGTGFAARRHLDAIAMSLWPSRGLELLGFEVKCDRSDFRRELKQPEKADDVAKHLDRFYIVAPKDVVPKDELPAAWGLYEIGEKTVRKAKEAMMIGEPKAAVPRSFLAAVLRRSAESRRKELGRRFSPEDYDAAVADGIAKGIADQTRNLERNARVADERREALERLVKDFSEQTGIAIAVDRWSIQHEMRDLAKMIQLARAVRDVDIHVPAILENLDRARKSIEFAHKHLSQSATVPVPQSKEIP